MHNSLETSKAAVGIGHDNVSTLGDLFLRSFASISLLRTCGVKSKSLLFKLHLLSHKKICRGLMIRIDIAY